MLIRDVEIDGRPGLDVRIEDGVIAEIGRGLRGRGPDLDGRGGALIPGLIDHHIHLLALASARRSLEFGAQDAIGALRDCSAALPKNAWLRATNYHDSLAGSLDRERLDEVIPDRPARVQYRTGSLWILNSQALDLVGAEADAAPCIERGRDGRATGRIWRGDTWLKSRLHSEAPPLADVSRDLVSCGVTALTDASATTGEAEAALLAGACAPRLMLMSAGDLPPSKHYAIGPRKFLLDEHDLPDLEEMRREIQATRRPAAFHCVTAAELAFVLAAGARAGDRIEHGGVIPPEAAREIFDRGITVVTQPGFIAERGDHYLAEVDPADRPFLYPCGSLLRGGVKVAGSSDAPYGDPDPWKTIAAAVDRRTRSGQILGPAERIAPARALQLFLGPQSDPGGPPRRVAEGAPADLCLLHLPITAALTRPSRDLVAATVIAGTIVHHCH